MILPNDLAIYFIEQKETDSKIYEVELNNRGEFIEPPTGLLSFFSDDYFETVKWTKTIAKIASQENDK